MTPKGFLNSRSYKLLLRAFCLTQILWIGQINGQNRQIDSLLILLKTDKADTNKVNHQNILCRKYINIGLYDTAISFGNSALQLSLKLNFKKGVALSYNNLGLSYYNLADYSRALDYYLKALKTDEEQEDKRGMSLRLGNIGSVYSAQNETQKALDYFLKALKIAQEMGNKPYIAAWLGNIGNVFVDKADYSKALEYYFKALKIDEELGSMSGMAYRLGSIGIIYKNQGNYLEALNYYQKALKLDEELENKNGVARHLCNIGSLYVKTGELKNAEQCLKKAIVIYDSIGALDDLMLSEDALSQLYDTIAQLSVNKGQWEKAAENYIYSILHSKKAISIKDTIFSQENKKELVRKEMNYEFDKKETATRAETEKQQALAAEKNRIQKIISWSIAGGLLLVLLFSGFILRSLRITRQQKSVIELQKNEVSKQKEIADSQRIIAEGLREIAEKQKHIVEEKQKEIVDSITYAKRIQTALLTSVSYINEHLPAEHFILFKPKDIVSGDFYWALSIPSLPGWDMGTNKVKLHTDHTKQNTFYIATADCTGHGVPGAFMSMLNISYLNENVIERGIRLPHDILNAQRTKIINALNPIGSIEVSKDGMDCVLCVYDFNKMLLHVAAANNPLWLIRNNELIEYKADKMPVGKYSENMTSFTLQTIELQKGDTIYTSTDGFADQFGTNGKKLMKKKLKEELLKIHQEPMIEQKQHLEQFFENWKGNTEQVDDVCIIGVRI
jgi:tetratricopeptide (TPR) repeat protein